MIGLLVLAACLALGFAILRLAGADLKLAERLVAGIIVGLAAGSATLFLFAWTAGAMGWTAVAAFVALVTVVSLGASRRPPLPHTPVPRWFVLLSSSLAAVITAMNLYGVLAHTNGSTVAQEHVWADAPFHTSIITSFAYGANYPPTYPVALGEPLSYPFLVDFLSAAAVWGGMGLRWSVVVVNVLLQLSFFAGVALVAARVTRSHRAAVLATVVLFSLGNLGWLAIPADIAAAGGVWHWITDLPWSYTGDALGEPGRERLGTGLYLGNPTFIHLIPRRSAAFGLAAGATVLLLLDDLLERRRVGVAVVTGLLLGLLPRIHAHTAIAMLVVLATWIPPAVLRSVREGKSWRAALRPWVIAGAVAVALAVPQVADVRHQASGFFEITAGWIGEPAAAARAVAWEGGTARVWAVLAFLRTAAWFWLLNGGLLLVLLVPAWLWADRRSRVWYLPFAALWLFGNVIRTQPWEWDNNNYFVYWQVGTTVVVSAWLSGVLCPTGERARARSSVRVLIAKASGVVAVASLVLGGMLSFAFAAQHRHHLWTDEEAAFVERVRDATSPRDAILTSNGHTHPVMALSGRRGYMGFPGWLSTHGLDWRTYESRLERMLRGDVELMREVGVDYVVVGPWEGGFARDRGFSPLQDAPDSAFEPVLRDELNGRTWTLMRLVPPRT